MLRKDLGNGQLTHDFIYGDPRRAAFNGGEPGVTFAVNKGWTSSDANLTDQIGWLYDSIFILQVVSQRGASVCPRRAGSDCNPWLLSSFRERMP